MAKDKKRDDQGRFTKDDDGAEETTVFNPFVGGEEDDLSDMRYVQDSDTVVESTHPPETKEEADILAAERAEQAKKDAEKAKEEDDAVSDDETQDEAEEEPAEAEAEAEEVLAEPDDEPRIPKSRLDEVLEQKKKEKERADKLEMQLQDLIEEKKKPKEPEPEPFDYVAKEKESYDAFLEGDTEKYSAIQQEIREANKAELQREAKRIAAEGDQTTKEELTFQETGDKIEAEYPQLVKGDENFNEDAYDDLMELYVGYASTGRYTKAEALQKAADKSVRMYDLKKAGEETLADKADNVVDIKKPDVKKKKEIADKQPPVKQSGVTRDDELSIDITSMSDEEFEALPEATKRRMRGDVL